MSVSTGPRCNTVTPIPVFFVSILRLSPNLLRPAFEAQYTASPGVGVIAATEDVKTRWPAPLEIIPGNTWRVKRCGLNKLVVISCEISG